jgi:group I intron endonuclease
MRNKKIISCVYCIENKINNKKYIGSTDNLRERWMNHRIDLRNNHHKNHFLQADYNQYGLENFIFYILEECAVEELSNKEDEYIVKNKCMYYEDGYNINFGNKLDISVIEKIVAKTSGVSKRLKGKRRKNPTSKYLGVDLKNSGRYYARIYLNGTRYDLGSFQTELEAAMAYNEASLELLGWKAKLNIITEEEIENLWKDVE